MKFQVGDVVRRVKSDNRGGYPNPLVLSVGTECVVAELLGYPLIAVAAKGVPLTAEHSVIFFELVHRPVTDPVPDARSNDPATSKAAAKAVKPKKAGIKVTILDLLEKYQAGLTGEEMARHTGYRLNSVTPRFAELHRDSKIKVNRDVPTRSGQTVWVLS